MSIIYGIIIFGLVIFVHEFGHFIVAKANGIQVVEFSIGMGPRIFSKMGKETRYSLKWIPFGGSCRMLGDDNGIPDPDAPQIEGALAEKSFNSKNVWARISVIFAGPFFNFLLAFVCGVIIVGLAGIDKPILSGVLEGFPAETAGLQAGDQIVSMDGHRMYTQRDVSLYIEDHIDEEMAIKVNRNGEIFTVDLTAQWSEEDQTYYIGITWNGSREKVNPIATMGYSIHEVGYWIRITFKSLGMLFTGGVSVDDLAGPVGIVDAVGDVVEESKSDGGYYIFLNLVNMALLINANIGVMNLLPLPALDGGRLAFLFIEAVRGKPVDREKEGYVHMAGIILLFLLMIFVMFNDIRRVITG